MNMFTNSGKTKKFILVLVFLLLFNFCFPKTVKAWEWVDELIEHVKAIPARLIWWIEEGVLLLLNDIFGDQEHQSNFEINGRDRDYEIWLTPEAIIKGKYLLFNANIFERVELDSENDQDNKYYDDGAGTIVEGKNSLRNTVAGWYYAVRNLAIVALLTVLVYVGIRMILSTIAQDKAKYKAMFKDWLVALCLVVLMHYIMIAILNITSIVTEAIGGGVNSDMISKYAGQIESILSNSDGYDSVGNTVGLEYMYTYQDSSLNKLLTLKDAYVRIVIMFAIIIFTVLFAIKYLKREFTVLFLILLGPISCITYPIDKISDGKAQAFNKWLTEFLYQVIIQPFHLLLYVVLIGAGAELAESNILYALVCFGVMIPAEKFVKEMFGFKDKLGSPLGSFAAGAMASKLMSALTKGGGKSKGAVEKGGDEKDVPNKIPTRTHDKSDEVGGERPRLQSGEGDSGDDGGNGRDGAIGADGQNGGSGGNGNSVHLVAEPERIEGLPVPQEGDRTNPQEGDGINPQEGDRTNPQEGDGINPQEVDRTNPEEDDGTKPKEVDRTNPEEDDGTKPKEGDRTNPQEDDGTKPKEKYTTKQKIKNLASKVGKSKFGQFTKKNWNAHKRIVSNKYGTTSRGKRWLKRAGKGARFLGRVAKVGAVATVAAAGATAAIATGNGKEAFGLLAGAAGYATKEAVSMGTQGVRNFKNSAKGSIKEYANAHRDTEGKGGILRSKEQIAFRKFKDDPKQMEKARESYMKNHNGEEPSGAALKQEIRDRFSLAREGMTDEQIDKALPLYQEKNMEHLEKQAKDSNINIDELKQQAGGAENLDQAQYRKLLEENLDDKKVERAAQIAGAQSKRAQELASYHKESDFLNESSVNNMYNRLFEGFTSKGYSEDIADKYARQYVQDAAKVKGVKTKLPPIKRRIPTQPVQQQVQTPPVQQEVEVPSRENFFGKWNIEEQSEDQTVTIESVGQIITKLKDKHGYTDDQLDIIVSRCQGKTNVELVNSLKEKVEYLTDEGRNTEIKTNIVEKEENKGLSDVQIQEKVNQEKIEGLERADIKEKWLATAKIDPTQKTEKKLEEHISKIREYEQEHGTSELRELAYKQIQGQLSDKDRSELKDYQKDYLKIFQDHFKTATREPNPNTSKKKGKKNK